MANDNKYSFIIGGDSTEFERALRGSAREAERLFRVMDRPSGLFNKDDLRLFDQGLKRLNTRVSELGREYKRLSSEAQRYAKTLDEIESAGGQRTGAQREALFHMQSRARSAGLAYETRQSELSEAQKGRGGVVQGVQKRREQLQVRSVAAGAGLGAAWVISQIRAGIQTAIDNERGRVGVLGVQGSRFGLGAAGRFGMQMGYTPAQAWQTMQATLQASGQRGARGTISNLAMMRGFGLDQGSLTGFQSAARQGGDNSLVQDLNRGVVQSFTAGQFPRMFLGEFLQALTATLQTQSGGREKVSAQRTANLMGFMSRQLGGVYGKSPQRTASLLQRMGGVISGPSGGEAGQSFMLRAMGFGRGTSYLDARQRMEAGLTTGNVRRMLMQTRREFGSGDNAVMALSGLSGGKLKIHEIRRLLAMDPSQLTDRTIASTVGGIKAPDILRQGKRAAGTLGFTRMEIGKQQAQAGLAAAMTPWLQKFHNAQVATLKATTKVAAAMTSFIKHLTSGHTFRQLPPGYRVGPGGSLMPVTPSLKGAASHIVAGGQPKPKPGRNKK